MAKIPGWKITDLARSLEPFLIQVISDVSGSGVCVTITCASTGFTIADASTGNNSGILSGSNNTIDANSANSVISGGDFNELDEADNCIIGGGNSNTIKATSGLASYNTIGGGTSVIIQDSDKAAIVGGDQTDIRNSDFAFIGGGNINFIRYSEDSVIVGGDANQIDSGASGPDDTFGSFIGGGESNSIGSANGSSFYSAVVGGLNNDIESGTYCFIGGGTLNTVARGGGSLDADYSAIIGGYDNDIFDSEYCVIGGGRLNDIGDASLSQASDYSGIFSGRENKIAGNQYASILGGYYGKADKYGQQAHASGRFSATGDAQRSYFTARRSLTHSATGASSLYLDGSASDMFLSTSGMWAFDALVGGTTQGAAQNWAYRITGAIKSVSGTATMLSSSTAVIHEDDSNFNAVATASDNALKIQVSDAGSSGSTVRWVASIRTAEVMFP